MTHTITSPPVPAVKTLPKEQREQMLEASMEIQECYRVMKKASMNVVGECLKNQYEGTFYSQNHYPKGDVYDPETHAQYYYHNHRGMHGEHGHFHTFLRDSGMPDNTQPVPYDGKVEWPEGKDRLSHFVAISMDQPGYPIGLFATNRWVTGENWYTAEDVIGMADRFIMDHAYPSWPVNRWITAMFKLFSPQIAALLTQRDQVVAQWADDHPGIDTFEDRTLEITGQLWISVNEQTRELERSLK